MSRILTFSLAVCVLLLMALPAQTELAWPQRSIELSLEPGQTRGVASFAFTNTGEQTITIERVTSTCGCTAPGKATLDQQTFAPGEAGTIEAALSVGEAAASGSVTRSGTILVHVAGREQPVRLSLKATAPQVLAVRPRLVWWRADEPREAKTIMLQLGETEGLKLAGVRVGVKRAAQSAEQQAEVVVEDPALRPAPRKPGLRTDAAEVATNERQPAVRVSEAAGVQVELKPVEGEAGQYELLVTPAAAASAHERIELDVLLPSGQVHTLTVQARVFPSVQQSAAAE